MKKLAKIRAVVFEKKKKPLNSGALQNQKTDVTEPTATLKTCKGQVFSNYFQV